MFSSIIRIKEVEARDDFMQNINRMTKIRLLTERMEAVSIIYYDFAYQPTYNGSTVWFYKKGNNSGAIDIDYIKGYTIEEDSDFISIII